MGMSPSADLYYGYDLGNMTDPETYDDLAPQWRQDDEDAEDVYAQRTTDWTDVRWVDEAADPAGHKAWIDNVHRRTAISKACIVEFAPYGYFGDGDTSRCVQIKASVQSVDDYGSITVQPLTADPAWNEQLVEYMRVMELPVPPGGPGWHLNCSYG